jgi:hypothetical protein
MYCMLPDPYYVLEGHTVSTCEFLQQFTTVYMGSTGKMTNAQLNRQNEEWSSYVLSEGTSKLFSSQYWKKRHKRNLCQNSRSLDWYVNSLRTSNVTHWTAMFSVILFSFYSQYVGSCKGHDTQVVSPEMSKM